MHLSPEILLSLQLSSFFKNYMYVLIFRGYRGYKPHSALEGNAFESTSCTLFCERRGWKITFPPPLCLIFLSRVGCAWCLFPIGARHSLVSSMPPIMLGGRSWWCWGGAHPWASPTLKQPSEFFQSALCWSFSSFLDGALLSQLLPLR